MNLLRSILAEIMGLFVDDEKLAVSILGVVGACWLIAHVTHDASYRLGLLLLLGLLGVLLASVLKGARR
ncbi:hypothetical protein [Bosea sp. BK604]|uniref:hypothetical protein n=1 Tax=Bosea sp. BK604 TaxID=2512180 RepID=UPI001052F300|nr:hypothetical protein [Bosea sp. BK604]TCR62961.1 hypothetical protein EV560_10954 [Bosea sp. BK604]